MDITLFKLYIFIYTIVSNMSLTGRGKTESAKTIADLTKTTMPQHEKFIRLRAGDVPLPNNYNIFNMTGEIRARGTAAFYKYAGGIPINANDITFPAAATLMSISSLSANDVFATGTGAWVIFIIGLDTDWNDAVDIVNLNGQTAVTSNVAFLRINQCIVLAAGTTGWNEGTIYISETGTSLTAGAPDSSSNVHYTVLEETNFGSCGIYSAGNNVTTMPTFLSYASDSTQSKIMKINNVLQDHGQGFPRFLFNTQWISAATTFEVTSFTFTEKTDFWVEAQADSGTINGSFSLQMWEYRP